MRRTLLLTLLLLATGAAEARVVQPPDQTERGGQVVPRGASGPDCANATMRCAGALPFGWYGGPEADMMARWNAAARAELAAGRPAWRSPRIGGKPLRRLLLPRRIQPRLR